jgi:DNA-binding PadR family transcriptional regulator
MLPHARPSFFTAMYALSLCGFSLDAVVSHGLGSAPLMLRYVLLALLADGSLAHGYALMKGYRERSGVRLSIGNVYRELSRLAAEGYIVAATNPPGADPRRAPYRITEKGRETLAAWLAAPVHTLTSTLADPLSHRLAILGDLDPAKAGGFLSELHAELWEQSKTLERERAVTSQRDKRDMSTLPTRMFLLGRRAKHLATDIEMVDEMRSLLAAGSKRSTAKTAAVVAESVPPRRSKQKPGAR